VRLGSLVIWAFSGWPGGMLCQPCPTVKNRPRRFFAEFWSGVNYEV